MAAAVVKPGFSLPRVEPEGDGGRKGERLVFSPVVVSPRIADLDGAALHGVKDLEAGNDLARGEQLYLELIVRELRNTFGEFLAGTVERIKRLRPTQRHAPFEFRRRLSDSRCSNR